MPADPPPRLPQDLPAPLFSPTQAWFTARLDRMGDEDGHGGHEPA